MDKPYNLLAEPVPTVGRLYLPWRLVWICLLLLVGGAVAGLAHYGLSTPLYMARMVIAPPDEQGEDRSVNLSFDLLRGGTSAQSETYEHFLFQLTSFETARQLVQNHPELVQQIREAESIESASIDFVRSYLADKIEMNRPRLNLVENSSFTEVMAKEPDRELARRLLAAVVLESDRLVRRQKLRELDAARQEIIRLLPGVSMMEYRESLIRLLAQTERQHIFARVNPTFSYRIVDSLTTSSKPVSPRLLLSLGLGLFAGLLLASATAIIWMTRVTVFTPARV